MIFINRQGVQGEVMTEKEKLVLFDNFPDKYHPSGPALRILLCRPGARLMTHGAGSEPFI